MNPLAVAWIGFIAAWKLWPPVKTKPPSMSDVFLSAILFIGLALLLITPQRKTPPYTFLLLVPFFGAAIYSRHQLGSTWNEPSERIVTGIYSVVPHPIYLAIFGAAIVTALANHSRYRVAGLSLVGASFIGAAVKDEYELRGLGE